MISKAESGRVGYRKKYRVASRVRVPAGHCRDREREVKMKKNSREFSRNENLAGLCMVNKFFVKSCQIIDSFQISKLRPGQISASSVARFIW